MHSSHYMQLVPRYLVSTYHALIKFGTSRLKPETKYESYKQDHLCGQTSKSFDLVVITNFTIIETRLNPRFWVSVIDLMPYSKPISLTRPNSCTMRSNGWWEDGLLHSCLSDWARNSDILQGAAYPCAAATECHPEEIERPDTWAVSTYTGALYDVWFSWPSFKLVYHALFPQSQDCPATWGIHILLCGRRTYELRGAFGTLTRTVEYLRSCIKFFSVNYQN